MAGGLDWRGERREASVCVWIRLFFLTKLGSFHNSTCTWGGRSFYKSHIKEEFSSNSPHRMGSFVWLTNTNFQTFREFLIVFFIYMFYVPSNYNT